MIIIYMHNKSIECHLIGEMLINIECSCCITIQCRTVSVWQSMPINFERMQKKLSECHNPVPLLLCAVYCIHCHPSSSFQRSQVLCPSKHKYFQALSNNESLNLKQIVVTNPLHSESLIIQNSEQIQYANLGIKF